MQISILEIKNLSKTFGGLRAVKNLNFCVNGREILGIIGPNGSGKTTIFNLILGYHIPDTGSVMFNDTELVRLKPHEICNMGLSRTFQLTKPFLNISVFDNVMVGAYNRTRDSRTAVTIATEMLEFVGLTRLKDQIAKNLTIPERKDLEIGRALATKPEILFLDEPVAGLNEAETAKMQESIKQINKMGITIVVIEHVMKAIMSLSNRIVVLNHGEKIAEGTPFEVAKNEKVISSYLGEEYKFA